jgi:hypothetical protein
MQERLVAHLKLGRTSGVLSPLVVWRHREHRSGFTVDDRAPGSSCQTLEEARGEPVLSSVLLGHRALLHEELGVHRGTASVPIASALRFLTAVRRGNVSPSGADLLRAALISANHHRNQARGGESRIASLTGVFVALVVAAIRLELLSFVPTRIGGAPGAGRADREATRANAGAPTPIIRDPADLGDDADRHEQHGNHPAEIRPQLAQVTAESVAKIQAALLDAALGETRENWMTFTCSDCGKKHRAPVHVPDVRVGWVRSRSCFARARADPRKSGGSHPLLPKSACEVGPYSASRWPAVLTPSWDQTSHSCFWVRTQEHCSQRSLSVSSTSSRSVGSLDSHQLCSTRTSSSTSGSRTRPQSIQMSRRLFVHRAQRPVAVVHTSMTRQGGLCRAVGSASSKRTSTLHGPSQSFPPIPPKDEGIALIRAAVEHGVTSFDTAQVYGPFTNEELVGERSNLSPTRS